MNNIKKTIKMSVTHHIQLYVYDEFQLYLWFSFSFVLCMIMICMIILNNLENAIIF